MGSIDIVKLNHFATLFTCLDVVYEKDIHIEKGVKHFNLK